MKGGVIWFSVGRIDRFVFALGVNEFVGHGPDRSAELLAWECRRRRSHSLGARPGKETLAPLALGCLRREVQEHRTPHEELGVLGVKQTESSSVIVLPSSGPREGVQSV